MELFLTHLGAAVSNEQEVTVKDRDSFFWLFKEYNVSELLNFERMTVPAYELAGDLLKTSLDRLKMEMSDIAYLSYCSQTQELPHSLVPSLKLRYDHLLTNAFTFGLSGQGSLTPLHGLQNIFALLQAEGKGHALLVTADQITAPYVHSMESAFPLGGASSIQYLSTHQGEYKVNKVYFSPHLYGHKNGHKNPIRAEFSPIRLDQLFGAIFSSEIPRINSDTKNIVILQYLSEPFISRVKNLLKSYNHIQLYVRKTNVDLNFLTSDLFISLDELLTEEVINQGDSITLVFADWQEGIGLLHLIKQ